MLPSVLSAGEAGKLSREVWFGIPGERVSELTSSARFHGPADIRDLISGSQAGQNIGDDYGQRLRGYITAPVTGDYTFWISGDNNCSLFLSTGESKFDKRRIASIDGAGPAYFVEPSQWDHLPSQQSQTVHLVAGQRYFIEMVHKEFWGGDHLSVAWQIPGGSREVVPASALESFTTDPDDLDNDELSDAWESIHHFDLADNGSSHPEQHPFADPDHDGVCNLQESLDNTDPNPPAGSVSGLPGRLTRELWLNLPGHRLAMLTGSPRFTQAADSVSNFAGAATPEGIADYYGSRIRGYVTAPVTGTYTFWVASDDDSELYLSTDGSKFNRSKIASLTGFVAPRQWDLNPSQKSAGVCLIAGQRYFIEALHKDGDHGDHLEIAWQVPGGVRELIPEYALESYTIDPDDLDQDEMSDIWETTYGLSTAVPPSTDPDQSPLGDPDHDGYSNLEEFQFSTDPYKHGGVPGSLLLETWNNLPRSLVTDLVWSRRFHMTPDRSEFVDSARTPSDRAEDFGARMRGYLIPSVSGDHTFYLSGDDACELWLSTGKSQFSKQKIAYQDSWSDVGQWTKFASQKSAVIPLVAGEKYYIEALQKEQHHGDHLEVGWTPSGGVDIEIIPGANLESYAYDKKDPDGDNMPSQWELSHGLDPAVNDAVLDPDFDGIPNGLEYAGRTNPQVKNRFQGALLHELWWNVRAFSVRSPITRQRMLQPPDEHTLALNTQGNFNYGEAYADRYRGYITAPVTGSYTFWANGDEEVEVWLSTSRNKFKKKLIVHPQSQIREWDADLSMKSAPVTLEAGELYYLQIIHVNHHGGDFCEVAWQIPGGQREIIPGSVLSSYIPVANDQDDDDLPDDWEQDNGLATNDNGLIDPRNGAYGDLDDDGLDNATEWRVHTRADLVDTDGDGVSDFDEVEILETNAHLADVTPFQSLVTIPGASHTASSGSWITEAGKARQDSVRGWLEYSVTLATAGVYQLDLGFTPVKDSGVSPYYEIVFSADGKTIQRAVVNVPKDSQGHAKVLTPWLAAGSHTLRVFLDNSYYFRRVTVDKLEILGAGGADADSNGTPDWVDRRLAVTNSLKVPHKSLTSPVCVEGKARWSELTTVAGATVKAAPNRRWYADVPLDASQPTMIAASLENGAIEAAREVTWVPVNLLECGDLIIRQGDSLKLAAYNNSANSNKPFTLVIDGQTHTISGQNPLIKLFDTPGNFLVNVTGSGNGGSASLTISVVGAPVIESPVCVVGAVREVEFPALPAGVTLQLDSGLVVHDNVTLPDGGTRYTLRLPTLGDLPAVTRIGTDGPVLGSVPFRMMRLRTSAQTGVFQAGLVDATTYDTQMPVIVDGAYSGTKIDFRIFIGGVTFDDGTISKSLVMPDGVDSGGGTLLHFYKTGDFGSNCHRIQIFQGERKIATY